MEKQALQSLPAHPYSTPITATEDWRTMKTKANGHLTHAVLFVHGINSMEPLSEELLYQLTSISARMTDMALHVSVELRISQYD